MTEEIITLIINEAIAENGRDSAYTLKRVLSEINLVINTVSDDLLAVKQMDMSEEKKEQVRQIILTRHKT